MSCPAVFLDKDGTLVVDVPYNVDVAKMELAEGARDALALFGQLDVLLFVVSNQSGVAMGKFSRDSLGAVEERLHLVARENSASLAGIYWCPHHPKGIVAPYNIECQCRKPKPGMLLKASQDHDIDLVNSWFIGDILDDVEAGNRAGCRTVLIDNGNETVWRAGEYRQPEFAAANLLDAAVGIKARMLEPVR